MAVANPRTDLLERGFAQQTFDLQERQEISTLAGGQTIGKSFSSALWAGEWTTGPEYFDDAVTFEAMLRSLDGVIGTFTAYDVRRPYPKAYPTGNFTDSGQINAIESNNKAMSLKNLPNGFTLAVGDYLSFSYGSPANRALHQVMEAATAPAGTTGTFEVRPHIRPGATANTAVTLKKPYAIFRLVPGGLSSAVQNGIFGTTTFRARQVIL